MLKEAINWYAYWFHTNFHAALYPYRDKDGNGIGLFMDNLTHCLNVTENGTISDLACGKRRYFYVNNMDDPYHKQFTAIFSMFTSFDYLDKANN